MKELYAEIRKKTDELQSMIGGESKCCGAKMYAGRCMDCKEMSDDAITDICPLNICEGSGEVSDYEYDSNVHMYYISGTKPCECQRNDWQDRIDEDEN